MKSTLIANFIYNYDSEAHKWTLTAYLSNEAILTAELDGGKGKKAINTLLLELDMINQIQDLGYELVTVNGGTYYFKELKPVLASDQLQGQAKLF